jgi:hypothetical protein
MDPRSLYESSHTTLSDLDLLLAESDRDDPFLAAPLREDTPRDEDAIDHQILAGLVTP